jgi:hypothetical protein
MSEKITNQRLWYFCWCIGLCVFLLVTAYYIIFHHVSPLSRDQWHMYDALFTQGLWQTSITTMSGHRHILAFTLYDIDWDFFAGKNHFLILVDWILNGILIAVICWKISSYVDRNPSKYFLMGWSVLLLCWLINIALLGWGFNGINNYLSILNTVLSVLFLYTATHQDSEHSKKGWLCLFLALFCGCLAMFSFGNGNLVWPISLFLLFLYRAKAFYFVVYLLVAAACFALYLVLPGGGAVEQALHFNGWETLAFPVTLMGAPAFHLLRAWRIFSEDMLVFFDAGIGALVCVLAVYSLWVSVKHREKNDALDMLAIALILIGFGTVALLMLTRVEGVLDPTVDRFQIWALLVWLGVSLLLYRRIAPTTQRWCCVFFLIFPLMALPSQLDWGARLAEYRTRVDNALLAYQVYLPVAEDAEKALHWNWQGKLPHFFPILEKMRTEQRNVFADGAWRWLGQPLPADAQHLPTCHWSVLRAKPLHASDMLDVQPYPQAERYITTAAPTAIVGWRWYGNLDEPAWDVGLVADASGVVRGLLHATHSSVLPRASGLMNGDGNAYGVAKLEKAATLVVLRKGVGVCQHSL